MQPLQPTDPMPQQSPLDDNAQHIGERRTESGTPSMLGSVVEEPVVKGFLRWGHFIWGWSKRMWIHTVRIALRADEDHIFMLAAGIAFNIIISLVPTILVMLFVLGTFLNTEVVVSQLTGLAQTYIIGEGNRRELIETFQKQIDVVVENKGVAGLIGIIGLLWSASALAASIRVAINKVLHCRETRNYLIYKLYDILAIMLIGMLVFASIVTGPLLQLVLAVSDKISTYLDVAGFEWLISETIHIVTTTFLFYVIFRYVPYQKQDRHIIWIATLSSALLWILARYLFSFYLTEFGTLGRVYGAYAFFAAAALWIYFSSLVFLIGAEIAYHIKQSRWNARRTFEKISRQTTTVVAESNGRRR